jgi:mono/diheme cytochrome c family protein
MKRLTLFFIPFLVACSTDETVVMPDPHLERMLVQRRANAYGETRAFDDGMVMRTPPHGAVATNAIVGPPVFVRGADANGNDATTIPMDVTMALLDRGRVRFESLCATCHGIEGNGVSAVAAHMTLRQPPSLVEANILTYTPGQIYQRVREGYGLMPSYASQLTIEESWAVVAYTKALQISRHASIQELPLTVRDELSTQLARSTP